MVKKLTFSVSLVGGTFFFGNGFISYHSSGFLNNIQTHPHYKKHMLTKFSGSRSGFCVYF